MELTEWDSIPHSMCSENQAKVSHRPKAFIYVFGSIVVVYNFGLELADSSARLDPRTQLWGTNAERSGTENDGVRAKAPIVRENDVGGSRAMSQITYTY